VAETVGPNTVGVVSQLWRHPAKSMQGERLESAPVGPRGIAGDRGWAVRDERRGGIRGAKKIAGLMQLTARYDREPQVDAPPPPITITLPDGGSTSSGDPDVHERLSTALEHPVTLWPLLPPDARHHYRRGAPDHDDLEAELRAIFGRTSDEPLPDLSWLPTELFEYESIPGTYFDAHPILILTRQSLEHLGAIAPGSTVDVRRFRPNLVVDAPDADGRWPEREWLGRSLRVAGTTFDVVAPCPRCVMVTHPFADLAEDGGVLRAVVRGADQILGVYATVRGPATITVGDTLELD
jgi:uncharacterized protein YcbX